MLFSIPEELVGFQKHNALPEHFSGNRCRLLSLYVQGQLRLMFPSSRVFAKGNAVICHLKFE